MADDEAEKDHSEDMSVAAAIEALQTQLHNLFGELKESREPPVQSASQYCQHFCQTLVEYADRWKISEDPLPLVEVYMIAILSFAEARHHLTSECESVGLVLERLVLSCVELLLSLPEQIPKPLWSKFQTVIKTSHSQLLENGNTELHMLSVIVQEEGVWSHPVLHNILSKETIETEKVKEFLQAEGPMLLNMRVKHLIKVNQLECAASLARACADYPEFGGKINFKQTYLVCLCAVLPQDQLMQQISEVDCKDALEMICNLESEGEEKSALALCTAFLTRQFLQEDMYCAWELTLFWSKLQQRVEPSTQVFLDCCRRLSQLSKTVYHIFFLIKVIQSEVEDGGLAACIELCIRALRMDSIKNTNIKATICKTIICLLPNDLEVRRACQLTEFLLEPTVESYYSVETLYNEPDQKLDVENLPVPNSLRCELLLVLKTQWPFDPEFWDWKTLKRHCLGLMGEEASIVCSIDELNDSEAFDHLDDEDGQKVLEQEFSGLVDCVFDAENAFDDLDDEKQKKKDFKKLKEKGFISARFRNWQAYMQYCVLCDKEFLGHRIVRHAQKHVKDGVYHCPICAESFNRKELFVPHVTSHVKQSCKERLAAMKSNRRKITSAKMPTSNIVSQKVKPSEKQENRPKKKNRLYSNDFVVFNDNDISEDEVKGKLSKIALAAHRAEYKEEYTCPVNDCKKGFKYFKNLVAHVKGHKNNEDAKRFLEMQSKKVVCQYCRRQFVSVTHLNDHLQMHCGVKPYICIQVNCKSSFSTNSELLIHRKEHTVFKAKCMFPNCGRIFYEAYMLYDHEAQHYNTFTCKSPDCGKIFHSQAKLDLHQEDHLMQTNNSTSEEHVVESEEKQSELPLASQITTATKQGLLSEPLSQATVMEATTTQLLEPSSVNLSQSLPLNLNPVDVDPTPEPNPNLLQPTSQAILSPTISQEISMCSPKNDFPLDGPIQAEHKAESGSSLPFEGIVSMPVNEILNNSALEPSAEIQAQQPVKQTEVYLNGLLANVRVTSTEAVASVTLLKNAEQVAVKTESLDTEKIIMKQHTETTGSVSHDAHFVPQAVKEEQKITFPPAANQGNPPVSGETQVKVKYNCTFDGCTRTYSCTRSVSKHMKAAHAEYYAALILARKNKKLAKASGAHPVSSEGRVFSVPSQMANDKLPICASEVGKLVNPLFSYQMGRLPTTVTMPSLSLKCESNQGHAPPSQAENPLNPGFFPQVETTTNQVLPLHKEMNVNPVLSINARGVGSNLSSSSILPLHKESPAKLLSLHLQTLTNQVLSQISATDPELSPQNSASDMLKCAQTALMNVVLASQTNTNPTLQTGIKNLIMFPQPEVDAKTDIPSHAKGTDHFILNEKPRSPFLASHLTDGSNVHSSSEMNSTAQPNHLEGEKRPVLLPLDCGVNPRERAQNESFCKVYSSNLVKTENPGNTSEVGSSPSTDLSHIRELNPDLANAIGAHSNPLLPSVVESVGQTLLPSCLESPKIPGLPEQLQASVNPLFMPQLDSNSFPILPSEAERGPQVQTLINCDFPSAAKSAQANAMSSLETDTGALKDEDTTLKVKRTKHNKRTKWPAIVKGGKYLCSRCFREFPSPKSLGGHLSKRSHCKPDNELPGEIHQDKASLLLNDLLNSSNSLNVHQLASQFNSNQSLALDTLPSRFLPDSESNGSCAELSEGDQQSEIIKQALETAGIKNIFETSSVLQQSFQSSPVNYQTETSIPESSVIQHTGKIKIKSENTNFLITQEIKNDINMRPCNEFLKQEQPVFSSDIFSDNLLTQMLAENNSISNINLDSNPLSQLLLADQTSKQKCDTESPATASIPQQNTVPNENLLTAITSLSQTFMPNQMPVHNSSQQSVNYCSPPNTNQKTIMVKQKIQALLFKTEDVNDKTTDATPVCTSAPNTNLQGNGHLEILGGSNPQMPGLKSQEIKFNNFSNYGVGQEMKQKNDSILQKPILEAPVSSSNYVLGSSHNLSTSTSQDITPDPINLPTSSFHVAQIDNEILDILRAFQKLSLETNSNATIIGTSTSVKQYNGVATSEQTDVLLPDSTVKTDLQSFESIIKPFVCESEGCPYSAMTKDALFKHYHKIHNYDEDKMNEIRKNQLKFAPFRCHICNKTFTRNSNLRAHCQAVHHLSQEEMVKLKIKRPYSRKPAHELPDTEPVQSTIVVQGQHVPVHPVESTFATQQLTASKSSEECLSDAHNQSTQASYFCLDSHNGHVPENIFNGRPDQSSKTLSTTKHDAFQQMSAQLPIQGRIVPEISVTESSVTTHGFPSETLQHTYRPQLEIVQPTISPLVGDLQPINRLPSETLQQHTLQPASGAQLPVLRPASGILQPLLRPTLETLQPLLRPASGTLQPLLKPASGTLQPLLRPASGTLQTTFRPMSGTLHPTFRPVSGALQPILRSTSGTLQPILQSTSGTLQPVIRALSTILQPSIKSPSATMQPNNTPLTATPHSSIWPPTGVLQSLSGLASGIPQSTISSPLAELQPSVTSQSSVLQPTISSQFITLQATISAAAITQPQSGMDSHGLLHQQLVNTRPLVEEFQQHPSTGSQDMTCQNPRIECQDVAPENPITGAQIVIPLQSSMVFQEMPPQQQLAQDHQPSMESQDGATQQQPRIVSQEGIHKWEPNTGSQEGIPEWQPSTASQVITAQQQQPSAVSQEVNPWQQLTTGSEEVNPWQQPSTGSQENTLWQDTNTASQEGALWQEPSIKSEQVIPWDQPSKESQEATSQQQPTTETEETSTEQPPSTESHVVTPWQPSTTESQEVIPQQQPTTGYQKMTPQQQLTTESKEVTHWQQPTTGSQEVTPWQQPTTGSQEVSPRQQPTTGSQEVTPRQQPTTGSQEVTPQEQATTGSQELTPQQQSTTGSQEVTLPQECSTGSTKVSPPQQSTTGYQDITHQQHTCTGSQELSILQQPTTVYQEINSQLQPCTESKSLPPRKVSMDVQEGALQQHQSGCQNTPNQQPIIDSQTVVTPLQLTCLGSQKGSFYQPSAGSHEMAPQQHHLPNTEHQTGTLQQPSTVAQASLQGPYKVFPEMVQQPPLTLESSVQQQQHPVTAAPALQLQHQNPFTGLSVAPLQQQPTTGFLSAAFPQQPIIGSSATTPKQHTFGSPAAIVQQPIFGSPAAMLQPKMMSNAVFQPKIGLSALLQPTIRPQPKLQPAFQPKANLQPAGQMRSKLLSDSGSPTKIQSIGKAPTQLQANPIFQAMPQAKSIFQTGFQPGNSSGILRPSSFISPSKFQPTAGPKLQHSILAPAKLKHPILAPPKLNPNAISSSQGKPIIASSTMSQHTSSGLAGVPGLTAFGLPLTGEPSVQQNIPGQVLPDKSKQNISKPKMEKPKKTSKPEEKKQKTEFETSNSFSPYRPYRCVHQGCSAAFTIQPNLILHYKAVHQSDLPKFEQENEDELDELNDTELNQMRELRCQVKNCSRIFQEATSLFQHYTQLHEFNLEQAGNLMSSINLGRFQCDQPNCKVKFTVFWKYIGHLEMAHDVRKVLRNEAAGVFKCDCEGCDRVYATRSNLLRHLFRKHKESHKAHLIRPRKKLPGQEYASSIKNASKKLCVGGKNNNGKNVLLKKSKPKFPVIDEKKKKLIFDPKSEIILPLKTCDEALAMCIKKFPMQYPCMIKDCDSVVSSERNIIRHYKTHNLVEDFILQRRSQLVLCKKRLPPQAKKEYNECEETEKSEVGISDKEDFKDTCVETNETESCQASSQKDNAENLSNVLASDLAEETFPTKSILQNLEERQPVTDSSFLARSKRGRPIKKKHHEMQTITSQKCNEDLITPDMANDLSSSCSSSECASTSFLTPVKRPHCHKNTGLSTFRPMGFEASFLKFLEESAEKPKKKIKESEPDNVTPKEEKPPPPQNEKLMHEISSLHSDLHISSEDYENVIDFRNPLNLQSVNNVKIVMDDTFSDGAGLLLKQLQEMRPTVVLKKWLCS
ncbi:zinc finger protein 292b isoform X5 [Erpetoichthys calabaricus]|uniref:zinc finger protein 292b isoform X5 n=1 Tax=Erpetoichthys calabaricus TaxID=27687 RepID=UPI0022349116|nr:zinc finger protein 292b isoform X5 [Erpetoichthys calabaricus]